MLMLTNDLHERDDQIADLRLREVVLEDTLRQIERMYQQEIRVSVDLTNRLDEALQEKEEANYHLRIMKVRSCFIL